MQHNFEISEEKLRLLLTGMSPVPINMQINDADIPVLLFLVVLSSADCVLQS